MRSAPEIVEILEEFLKKKKITMRQFCGISNIPHTTISTWKHRHSLPSIDCLTQIAQFMGVSLDWLILGELADNENNTLENPCSRKSILYRTEIVLRQMNIDYDYDTERLHEKYLSDIINYDTLCNWVEGKVNISENVLPAIANRLKVPLQWLLTQEGYNQEDFDSYLYGLSKAYPKVIRGYNLLDEEDKEFVSKYIFSKLEMQSSIDKAQDNNQSNN